MKPVRKITSAYCRKCRKVTTFYVGSLPIRADGCVDSCYLCRNMKGKK